MRGSYEFPEFLRVPKMSNPYIYRGAVRSPDLFFGRQHELQEIAAFLNGNQSVSIVGPRKIGKTSLLMQLMRPQTWPALGLADANLFVYLDCEVLGESTHEEIFGHIASEIQNALEDRALPEEPALALVVESPSRLSFEGAIRKLNRRDLRVIIILDEFERLSANGNLNVNFFNALRSAAGRYQLVFLTASSRPLIQLTYSSRSQDILSSPFFNIFAPVFLRLFSEEEARQLIRVPAQRQGRPFATTLENFIFTLAGGHPLALQVACFHAWEVADEGPNAEVELSRRVMQELHAHFQYYWHNLTHQEQRTLRTVRGAEERDLEDTTLREVLRELVQKSLLVPGTGHYRYPSRAWADFVSLQTPTTSDAIGPSHELSGASFGAYEVLELIGRGGMAEVYRGRHIHLKRTVAIKILAASLAEDVDSRQRFEREAQAVATLDHDNIVHVYDFGFTNNSCYMVIEYIEGQTLADYLHLNGRLTLEQALPILEDVASALDYAHEHHVVHRDVKPSNVMLQMTEARPCPKAFLTDFGVAKIRTGLTATRSGIVGTLEYMAPEQIVDSTRVDHRIDVYALGIIAYQAMTGRLPFTGDNPGAIVMAHVGTPVPDPRREVPDLSAGVAQAIQKALAKDPNDRFATAGAFAAALSAVFQQQPAPIELIGK